MNEGLGLSNFASLVDRLAGATQKVPRSARYGEGRAKWFVGADAVFAGFTEFLLSTLIFLTIAGVVVAIGG
jgi:hypothetical protein